MASMAHSIPFPGPSRPQVNTRGPRSVGPGSAFGASAGGVAAPCGMTTTFEPFTSKHVVSLVRAVSVMTTTAFARSQACSSTCLWFFVGELSTVWATMIVGTAMPAIVSRTSAPS